MEQEIRVETRQSRANDAAELYKFLHYTENSSGGFWPHDDYQHIYNKLLAASCDIAKINTATGDTSLTKIICDQCGSDVATVVVYGYTQEDTRVCCDCLEAAAKVVRQL